MTKRRPSNPMVKDMTLRDWFAGMVSNAIAHEGIAKGLTKEQIIDSCYQHAEEMLERRTK